VTAGAAVGPARAGDLPHPRARARAAR